MFSLVIQDKNVSQKFLLSYYNETVKLCSRDLSSFWQKVHKGSLIILKCSFLSLVYMILFSNLYCNSLVFVSAVTVNSDRFSPAPFKLCSRIVAQIVVVSFHFSAWGESLFMSIQTCLMVVMYFYYTSRPLPGIIFPFLYCAICYVLVSGLTPMAFLVQFVSLNVVFLVISRVSMVLCGIFFSLTHFYT